MLSRNLGVAVTHPGQKHLVGEDIYCGLSIRETVHAHIYACYSHMCHSAHICEYDNWKFEDIWKKTVGENSSFYILLRN